jgi:integrative and conjugative element protein (TIGR02256 family)
VPPCRRKGSLSIPVVWIHTGLLAELHDLVREHAPLETGGMLLGWHNHGKVAIDATINGGPAALRSRTSFIPDGPWQQQQLAAVYEQSGRTVTYLGDWHSHPRGPARPSGQDRKTAAAIAASEQARAPYPITLIVGRNRRRAKFIARAYIHTANGKLRRATLQVHEERTGRGG